MSQFFKLQLVRSAHQMPPIEKFNINSNDINGGVSTSFKKEVARRKPWRRIEIIFFNNPQSLRDSSLPREPMLLFYIDKDTKLRLCGTDISRCITIVLFINLIEVLGTAARCQTVICKLNLSRCITVVLFINLIEVSGTAARCQTVICSRLLSRCITAILCINLIEAFSAASRRQTVI